ncbi:MAG: hypothetical protein HY924_01820 [Elusimicrobia bacterium]|nr:hypothetical protein [Elusimicrobiota bacterium]
MKTLILAACVIMSAGPLASAEGADKASRKSGAKSRKTAVEASRSTSTVPTKPDAAQDDKKPKTRTVHELIALVMAQGKERVVKSPSAENLGLTPGAATKAIRYKAGISPDGREHAFEVLYGEIGEGAGKPYGLVWGRIKVSKKEGVRVIEDGWVLRLSTECVLQAAFKSEGKEGSVIQTRYPTGSSEAQRIYAQERQFYLEDSLQLEMSLR